MPASKRFWPNARKTMAGTPNTLPDPPFVYFDGIPNCRDAGGWEIQGTVANFVRLGRILRSGDPGRASGGDVAKLRALGVKCVFDLRSNWEIVRSQAAGMAPVRKWEGIERHFSPLITDSKWDPIVMVTTDKAYMAQGEEGTVKAFIAIAYAGAAYDRCVFKRMIEYIVENPDATILVHCNAGKDRTGVFCALLLSFLGVSDELVAYEYAYSEQGLAPCMEAMVQTIMVSSQSTRDEAIRMVGSRKESMLKFLKKVDFEFGGAATYFEEICRISADTLQRLKNILII